MKTVYVPKGETVSFCDLATDHIVVKGHLFITGDLTAKSISGPGSVEAGEICANRINVGELRSYHVRCDELTASQAEALEVFASQRIAVSGKLTARFVKTKWLAMARNDIEAVEAGEIICLPTKSRGMRRFLLAARLRAWWTRFTAPQDDVVDAEFEPAGNQKTPVIDFEAESKNRPTA